MFNNLKTKLAHFAIKRKYLKKESGLITFNDFIQSTNKYLVLMPERESDFFGCFDIISYFRINQKKVTIFLSAKRRNLIPKLNKYEFILYDEGDISKLGLPNAQYAKILRNNVFDVAVDLNRETNLLCSAVTNMVGAKYRLGFTKENSDKYYNLQLVNNKINSEISYRNLLNSLQMF